MNNLFTTKNLSILMNIGVFILLMFVAFFKKGELSVLDGQLSFLTDKVNSIERMQQELAQKDTMLNRIQTENHQIQNYLLRQYEIQTIKLNEQEEDFVTLRRKLKEVGISVDNLNSNISISFQKIDSAVTKITGVDGTQITDTTNLYSEYSFKDSSQFLSLNGRLNIITGDLLYNYKYKANFDLLTYTKKEGMLGKRKMYGTLICDDPNANVGLKSIMIKQRRPTFHIGVGLGGSIYYSDKFKIAPSLSISLYKPIVDIYL